jgi:5-methylcytosine-specific restriction endonuclease McrA
VANAVRLSDRDRRGDWTKAARRRIIAHLARRDGVKCGLCRKRINLEIDTNARMGVTVDHIIPVSHGGTDDMANLRLAHRICNSIRQNVGDPEQLALVG